MRRRVAPRRVVASIVVTPLIDVVLVLLVLFLVLTPLVTRSVDVRKPHTTMTLPEDAPLPSEQIVVQVHPEGLWINGEAVPRGALAEDLKKRIGDGSSGVVFFQGAPDLSYGEVVGILDIIRASGADVLGIAPELNEQALIEAGKVESPKK